MREYVTECAEPAAVYAHDVTVVGWQHNDAARAALPYSTVTIAAPSRTYVIATGVILPGALARPYELAGVADVATGETTYTGCDAYRPTEKTERWSRPDGTAYLKVIGPGAPVGPRPACETRISEVWPRIEGPW